MKKTIIVLLMLSISYLCITQNDNKLMKWDSKAFEGVWLAKSGTKEYELTLRKQAVSNRFDNYSTEMILGCIIYSENGKVTRTTVIDGLDSFLVFGDMYTHKRRIELILRDRLRNASSPVLFELKAGDDTTASWTLDRETFQRIFGSKWSTGSLDIPTTLEFKKIK